MDADALRWVIAVAKAGSLSRVAKARGVAVSTVARRLDSLEAQLGLTLLDRRRDGVRLTAEGERVCVLGAEVIERIDRLEREASVLRSPRRNTVVVSATEFILAEVLAPALPALAEADGEIVLDLRSQGHVVSLAAREADLAVRMSPPEGASLMSRALTPIALGFFASPTYLARRDPGALDLRRQRLLAYDDGFGRLPEMDALREAGLDGALVAVTNSTRALLTAAAAGAGVALLPRTFAERAGLLAVRGPALAARRPYLVTHRDLRRRRDIDMVHRWIVAAFQRGLAQAKPSTVKDG